jgi:hypothetical protein
LVPWYDTQIGLGSPPAAPKLGTFVSLTNEANFLAGGISWAAYFASSASAYAAKKDEFDNFRFEVRSGDIADADVVAGNLNTQRAEINHNGSLDQTKIINISYLQMIAGGDAIIGNNLYSFGQLHQVTDAGDVKGVVPLLMHCGDYTQVSVRAMTTKPTLQNPPIVDGYFGRSPARDVWTSYRWRFKYAADGFLQIFRNGALIVDYVGPFGYNNVNGPSPQFGIYCATTPETIVVYYSGISIAYE